jgi:hypothetical protein
MLEDKKTVESVEGLRGDLGILERSVIAFGDEAVLAEFEGVGIDAGEAAGVVDDAFDLGAEGTIAGSHVEDGTAVRGGFDDPAYEDIIAIRVVVKLHGDLTPLKKINGWAREDAGDPPPVL